MELMDLFLTCLGASVVVYCGVKLVCLSQVLFPNVWFPLSKTFFTSMGEWAVVTGASEGIGRAYALALAEQGMNVVIMSRTKAKLDQVAKEIGDKTGQKVKVIVTDFIQENIFDEIEAQLKDFDIGVLVNNVGILPSIIPHRFIDCPDLDQTITNVINCNVRTMAKMCKIILPGMENRRKGLILNISSGVVCIPVPLYSLYAASKVFVHKVSQGLHHEYKDKGIIIQVVSPFGVSTRMTGYQATNLVTLSPEYFVKSSLKYVRAGDKTYGSVSHTLLSWLLQTIPSKLLEAESIQQKAQEYIKNRSSNSTSNKSTDNRPLEGTKCKGFMEPSAHCHSIHCKQNTQTHSRTDEGISRRSVSSAPTSKPQSACVSPGTEIKSCLPQELGLSSRQVVCNLMGLTLYDPF